MTGATARHGPDGHPDRPPSRPSGGRPATRCPSWWPGCATPGSTSTPNTSSTPSGSPPAPAPPPPPRPTPRPPGRSGRPRPRPPPRTGRAPPHRAPDRPWSRFPAARWHRPGLRASPAPSPAYPCTPGRPPSPTTARPPARCRSGCPPPRCSPPRSDFSARSARSRRTGPAPPPGGRCWTRAPPPNSPPGPGVGAARLPARQPP